jgi:hypothetical protein
MNTQLQNWLHYFAETEVVSNSVPPSGDAGHTQRPCIVRENVGVYCLTQVQGININQDCIPLVCEATVSCDVMSRSTVEFFYHFGWMYWIHLQGRSKTSTECLIYAFGLTFGNVGAGTAFLANVCTLTAEYMTSNPRRKEFTFNSTARSSLLHMQTRSYSTPSLELLVLLSTQSRSCSHQWNSV